MSKNYMPEVARMLGVEIGEEFDILVNEMEMLVHGPYKIIDNAIVDYVGCKTKNLLCGLLTGEYTLQKCPWRPKEGEGYYYIRSTDGFLSRSTFHNADTVDLALLNMGNCFPSKDAAEEAVPKMLSKFEEIKKGGTGVMDANTYWSFNKPGDEYWNNDLCDTMEEAEAEGRKWAKEHGLSAFVIGECKYVPIPTVVDLDDLFERLDYDYFYLNEIDDYDFYPYRDSDTPENGEHRKRLSAKMTEALKEYVEAAKITSSRYSVVNIYRVEVKE
ncbi:hypothetical protein [Eubacterium callanderi]|uniref:hypothetical protein n=1 Tax=Eubacterium callanderi TaxID=53442 RepID=UPI001C11BFAF|nr:hypothetical protein [Eubacterium callanderi]MBU5306078.1 hypothetical protein [Eubacterium callanderi]